MRFRIRATTVSNGFLDLDDGGARLLSLSLSLSFSLSTHRAPLPSAPLSPPPQIPKQQESQTPGGKRTWKMRSVSPLKAAALAAAAAFLLSGSFAAATFPGFNSSSVAAAKSAAEVRVSRRLLFVSF